MTIITRYIVKAPVFCILFLWCVAAEAQVTLTVPNGAKQQIAEHSELAKYEMPIGPWAEGAVPTKQVIGPLWQRAWQLQSPSITVDQLAEPIVSQMTEAGYTVVFDCHDVQCGGFDFRYSIKVFLAPQMFVNLRNFRFIAFEKANSVKTLLASKVGSAISFQLIEVNPEASASAAISQKLPKLTRQTFYTDLQSELLQNGYAVLSDLDYEPGSSKLGAGPFRSLQELATFMDTQPEAEIILVGHTDNTGASDANIALSKRRAASVVERLVTKYGITAKRLTADGVGFLAPLTANTTKSGREQNRRVEAVIKRLQ